jgi:hypothetical protein
MFSSRRVLIRRAAGYTDFKGLIESLAFDASRAEFVYG